MIPYRCGMFSIPIFYHRNLTISLQTVVVKLKKFKVHEREKMVSEQTGLTLEQRTFYQTNGYVVLENVLGREECQRFVEHMEDLYQTGLTQIEQKRGIFCLKSRYFSVFNSLNPAYQWDFKKKCVSPAKLT